MKTIEQDEGCRAAQELVRRAAIEHLAVEVNKREDMFLLAVDYGEAELNAAAIAEWTWTLLEQQREALTEAVMRALDDNDNDNDNDEEKK